jgi:hypothetical protein
MTAVSGTTLVWSIAWSKQIAVFQGCFFTATSSLYLLDNRVKVNILEI